MTLKRHIEIGGAREDRTPDLLRARQALSQLSYGPFLLDLFSSACVALVARSVTYLSMLLRSLRRTPCQRKKSLRKNLLADFFVKWRRAPCLTQKILRKNHLGDLLLDPVSVQISQVGFLSLCSVRVAHDQAQGFKLRNFGGSGWI